MQRLRSTPRDGWRELVEGQGLTYAVDRAEDGSELPYWDETAAYVLSEAEVDEVERVSEELHRMSVEAARHMVRDPRHVAALGLPVAATTFIERSLDAGEWSLYGRFDLAWDGTGDAKLLEYNADTPAGLVEAAVSQWYWLEDLHPDRDQANLLHERLVAAWAAFAPTVTDRRVHFAVGQAEPTEDWATVAYLRDTAAEAGLVDLGITMEAIGWDHAAGRFVDELGTAITCCFKMYPWEWMLTEAFAPRLSQAWAATRWVEPAWKTLLSSKGLLVALWELFPGHPNLLPARYDDPGDWTSYVAKPVLGWEGAGIDLVAPGVGQRTDPRHTAGQRRVFQAYTELPTYDGNHPVLGAWVVGDRAAGIGIRESTALVTDTHARFVPHLIDAPRSTPEQVSAWLTADSTS